MEKSLGNEKKTEPATLMYYKNIGNGLLFATFEYICSTILY